MYMINIMATKTWNANLSAQEERDFPQLFENVKKEFECQVKYFNSLWNSGDILQFLMARDLQFPPNIDRLSKSSDAMIVNMLYRLYEYFDCLDCLKQTNHPFINKCTILYHKARSNIIEQLK